VKDKDEAKEGTDYENREPKIRKVEIETTKEGRNWK
jgi:hypothetical protein